MIPQINIVSTSKSQSIQNLRLSGRLLRILVLAALGTLFMEVGYSQTTISVLKKNLMDTDLSVRLSAVAELAELGPDAREALPELIQALRDRNEEVRLTASEALGAIGKDAIPALIEASKNENVDIRWGAAEALRKIGPEAKAALSDIKRLLEDKDKLIRLRAAYTVAIFGAEGRAAVPILIEALNDQSPDERTRAVEALARIGVPAVTPLIQAMDVDVPVIRKGAADALGKIGVEARDSIPSLLKAVRDRDSSIRRHAASALGNFWPDAAAIAPPLIELLNDSDPTVVKAASHSLARLGQVARDAIPALTRLSKSHSTLVRRSAAESLGDISDTLYRYGSSSDIEALNNAYQALSTAEDREVRKHAERVKRTLDYLNLSWWGDIAEWPLKHPYVLLAVAFYPALLVVTLGMFWARPGWLLAVNERLSSSFVIKLPSWLSGNKVPIRYLLLVGFFHYRRRVLDAWVKKHVANAQQQFLNLTTVGERKIHVSSPVLLERKNLPNLTPAHLHSTFGKNRTCLLILGEGGSGKTSLACQLGKWAMADEKHERLCQDSHMLPILIEQDVGSTNEANSSLLVIIRNRLRALTGSSDPASDELIRELLKQKRLLIIVDSFSEMNESSRTNVLAGINDLLLNACIITSRTDVKLDTRTLLEPQRIRGNQLSSFMEAYLLSVAKRDAFDDDEFFEACKRLSLMVGDRDVTALLAKSYADQMIAAKEGDTEDLPENIPDLMIKYVSTIARQPITESPDIETVISVAKVIAWKCLEITFRPTSATRTDVLKQLDTQNGPSLLSYLRDKLRIIQGVGAAGERIRFSLDPLAEYLAALYLVDQYGKDEELWRQFLNQADQMEGAPDAIRGFLLAVRDCCLAKEKNVAAFVADELAKRTELVTEDRHAA